MLLISFSLIVKKSIGFLMTFLYPGTDLSLTGLRKGHASWWASSSANSTLKGRNKVSLSWTKYYGCFIQKRQTLYVLNVHVHTDTQPAHCWVFWPFLHRRQGCQTWAQSCLLLSSFWTPWNLFLACCCCWQPPHWQALPSQMAYSFVLPHCFYAFLQLFGFVASHWEGFDHFPEWRNTEDFRGSKNPPSVRWKLRKIVKRNHSLTQEEQNHAPAGTTVIFGLWQ